MKNKIILSIALFLLAAVLYAGGASENNSAPNNDSANNEADAKYITVTDTTGTEVKIKLPVKRVISINSGLSEVLAALGCTDLIVGRDNYSTFPSELKYVQSVARNSSAPHMEMMLSLEPDLVVADLMFDKSKREILAKRGIPVIIESTSNPKRLPVIVNNFAEIFGKQERAEYILDTLNTTLEQVENQVALLEEKRQSKPVVFFENRKPYKSASGKTGHHQFIVLAGGINIAENEPVNSPKLSPEYIVERNPDVIIRRVSGDINKDAMALMLKNIYERPSLQTVKAIQDKRVYIIKSDLFISLRYPVGTAYLAKIFYGDLASGLDEQEILKNYIIKLYGKEELDKIMEVYVYPELK
jgi:iron complex transport system substrate-binding protein